MNEKSHLLIEFETVSRKIESLIESLSPEQLRWTTPCDEWDVRHLVRHITETLDSASEWLSPDNESADSNGSVATGHHLFGDYKRAVEHFIATSNAAQGEKYDTPVGTFTAAEIVRMQIDECIVHGWDLATALETELDIPDALAEESLKSLKHSLKGFDRSEADFLAPEQTPPRGASPIDKLAAFMGRRV